MVKRRRVFLLILLFSLSRCSVDETWHTSTVVYFDTVCEIKVRGTSVQFKSAKETVHTVFSEIETLFSPGSHDLTSPKALYLFRRAREIHAGSDGVFDISIAPLVKLWGFYDRSYRVPSPDEIQRTLEHVGMTRIGLDAGGIRLPPEMEIDWGGIAKGYGIDLAAQALKNLGIVKGFINAGGDLYCWGANPENKAWQIGLKHPRKEGFLGVLSLAEKGAATTGDYQRFFIKEGVRYHHIFDPKSGYPSRGKQSVTVVGPETTLCDALATAIFISDHPDSILILFPEYGAIIIDANGRMSQAGKNYPFRLID